MPFLGYKYKYILVNIHLYSQLTCEIQSQIYRIKIFFASFHTQTMLLYGTIRPEKTRCRG